MVLVFAELVGVLVVNGAFIFKLARESRPGCGRGLGRGPNLNRIPRVTLAVGGWSCVSDAKQFGTGFGTKGCDKETRRVRCLLGRLFGVLIELYFGITLIVFTSKSPLKLQGLSRRTVTIY